MKKHYLYTIGLIAMLSSAIFAADQAAETADKYDRTNKPLNKNTRDR